MIIRIDARRLTDAVGLHAALNEAFGFPASYGNNRDALVDCLTHLDDAVSRMTRVQTLPGQLTVLVIEHADAGTKSAEQIRILLEIVAFVNWRRLEKGDPPVLAVACGPI